MAAILNYRNNPVASATGLFTSSVTPVNKEKYKLSGYSGTVRYQVANGAGTGFSWDATGSITGQNGTFSWSDGGIDAVFNYSNTETACTITYVSGVTSTYMSRNRTFSTQTGSKPSVKHSIKSSTIWVLNDPGFASYKWSSMP